MYRRSEKNLLNSSRPIFRTCPHNMVNFGPLTTEIGCGVWGTPANFNGFRVLASLLHRRRLTEVNQNLNDVWPSPVGLVHYTCIFFLGGGLLPPNGILSRAKFTLRPSLTFCYTGSATARHSSSGRQPNFAARYNESCRERRAAFTARAMLALQALY